jgi:putative membrane protein
MLLNDYLTLMLVNMSAGLLVLAAFWVWGLAAPSPRPWAAGLAIAGLVALLGGLNMVFTWPFRDKLAFANIAFGEMSVLFGAVLLGAALAVAMHWHLQAVSIFALVAGAAAIVVGIRIEASHLTMMPALTCLGYVLTGAVGVLSVPVVKWPTKGLRILVGLLSLAASAIWAFNGLGGYWMHLAPK